MLIEKNKGYFSKKLASREPFWLIATGLIVLAGFATRIKGLGKWPLATDEYYLAKSIQNLISHGLPEYACGGYYTRGLLFQYLSAPFVYFISNDEFALRFLPLVFNLLAIPPLFLLVKRASIVQVACVLAAFFSLSIWEIEFARFARMYAPFQTLFLWYVYFLYRVVVEEETQALRWMYSISILSIFFYEAGIFLIFMNFLALIKRSMFTFTSFRHILCNFFLFSIAYLYLAIDFRRLGVGNYLPSSVSIEDGSSMLLQPTILATVFPLDSLFGLVFCLILVFCGYALFVLLRQKEIPFWAKCFWLAIIMLSVLNQFGLAILVWALAILLHLPGMREGDRIPHKLILAAVLINFFFYFIYGILPHEWLSGFDIAGELTLKKLLKILFQYPNIYYNILVPWLGVMPILTILSGTLILFFLLNTLFWEESPDCEGVHFIAAVCLISCILVGLTNTYYNSTRYSFFIYPIFLILVARAIFHITKFFSRDFRSRLLVFVLFSIGFMMIVEDFNLHHLLRIDSQEVNFRTIYSEKTESHYYQRKDFRSPAQAINHAAEPEDIIVSMLIPAEYYLERLDYVFVGEYDSKFIGVSACGGRRELWTNARLLYENSQLFGLIGGAENIVWLIANSENAKQWFCIESMINEKYQSYLYSQSEDGRINVYKIHD